MDLIPLVCKYTSLLASVIFSTALTFELEGTRKSSSNEVNELREQLSTATVEQQRLKEELEGQLRLATIDVL